MHQHVIIQKQPKTIIVTASATATATVTASESAIIASPSPVSAPP